MAVDTKRVEEVASKIVNEIMYGLEASEKSVKNVLSKLPEFQKAEWVKCSERMPEHCQPIWIMQTGEFVRNGGATVPSMYYDDTKTFANLSCSKRTIKEDVTHWMPRVNPAPPVEEESECVKELREKLKRFPDDEDELSLGKATRAGLNLAIEIVKKHEKAGQK